ncbi:MAG TPA: amidohydrolase family protein [Myxococcota bacterium]|nr:amidohydrolase family protein [Myxococcota bacterium]
MTRRELLALLGALATGCGPGGEYTADDAARLDAQRRQERERSGRGPFGELRYRGYRGLAELPWFELDAQGRLRLAAEIPPAFDVHAHLGIGVLLAPHVDLAKRSERVLHLLDCDATDPGCALDLDVYINGNFTEEALRDLEWELARQLVFGSRKARTHTIPNLLDEMDAVGVTKAALLPIAFGLPFRDDLTEQWRDAVEAAGAGGRLLTCASVHPRDPERLTRLRGFAARGARAVKLHPAAQRFAASDAGALEIYAECERLGLPVFFHAGRAGIEPEAALSYNLVRHLEVAVASFPRVRFALGHAGARDVAEAIPLARRHPNVWLDTHGQGVTQLAELLESLGPERLLFGSDWPWYHLAASLAKVLIVTEGKPEARDAWLRGNAERFFERG